MLGWTSDPLSGVTMARRTVVCAAVLIGSLLTCPAGAAAARGGGPNPLEGLGFLLGTWGPLKSDPSGATAGTATFTEGLQRRVMIRTSFAVYPATAKAGETRHDDLMIIYAPDGGGIRADYYDNEGHVIRYAVTVPAAGEAVFVSEPAANAPRYRLWYRLSPDGALRGTFEIAPPGRPESFGVYLTWGSRKQ